MSPCRLTRFSPFFRFLSNEKYLTDQVYYVYPMRHLTQAGNCNIKLVINTYKRSEHTILDPRILCPSPILLQLGRYAVTG
jgi:hypothetical protein